MSDIFAEYFASRPPFKNYIYLLYQILFQIKTDEDYFQKHGNYVKDEIVYYILEMKSNTIYNKFLLSIKWLLPVLAFKVMSQDYGFGGEEDFELYVYVNNWILDEIGERNATCECDSKDGTKNYPCLERKGIDCSCQLYFRCCEYVHPFEL
jgi:hypothetical protein